MKALFIGQAYIDITFLTDKLPTGDEKMIAEDYSVSFGGNSVTAAFCCSKLGVKPDLLCSLADDLLARMFLDMAARYGLSIHGRKVQESSLSFIMPKDGKRAIVRCRDDDYLHPFPVLNLGDCKALHLDGHQTDAAIYYARTCRELGILTSFDGGAFRENTNELMEFIDISVVSERFCEQMNMNSKAVLEYLKGKGCRIGAVTLGEKGIIWYDETGVTRETAAIPIPMELVVDSNGAGDVFHGAYLYSYIESPDKSWEEHFQFAQAASSHSIQHLGNENSLPSLENVIAILNDSTKSDAA